MRRSIVGMIDRGGFTVLALAVLVTVLAATILLFLRLPGPQPANSHPGQPTAAGGALQRPSVDRAVLDSEAPASPPGQPEQ